MSTTHSSAEAETPAVDGLVFRRFRDPSDYHAMAAVSQAANLHDGEDWIPDAANMRVEFENTADLEPTEDILLAEVDGRVVAWGNVMRQVRDGLAVYAPSPSGAVDVRDARVEVGASLTPSTSPRGRTSQASSSGTSAARQTSRAWSRPTWRPARHTASRTRSASTGWRTSTPTFRTRTSRRTS